MILHLDDHDTRNTLIEQSVTALLEYIRVILFFFNVLLPDASLIQH